MVGIADLSGNRDRALDGEVVSLGFYGIREVGAEVGPSGLAAVQGGGNDGFGELEEVGGFAIVDGLGVGDVPAAKLGEGCAEVVFVAGNAGGVPHELLECGAGEGGFAVGSCAVGGLAVGGSAVGRGKGDGQVRGIFQFCRLPGYGWVMEEEVGGAVGEDDAFEQAVGGEAVGAVNAGAGDLADGEEAGEIGTAKGVGLDAAHPVVGGGGDGDGVVRPFEAGAGARGVDGGEALGEEVCAKVGSVEQDGLVVLETHLGGDAAGDDVTGGEFGVGVNALHEACAVKRAEDGAVAANGFGDEEASLSRQCRRVELVELEVRELGAGAEGEGYAVAGGYGGICRVREEVPGAAGGEEDGVRG